MSLNGPARQWLGRCLYSKSAGFGGGGQKHLMEVPRHGWPGSHLIVPSHHPGRRASEQILGAENNALTKRLRDSQGRLRLMQGDRVDTCCALVRLHKEARYRKASALFR